MDVPRARSRRIENGRGDLPGVETADEREDEVCPETGFFAPAADHPRRRRRNRLGRTAAAVRSGRRHRRPDDPLRSRHHFGQRRQGQTLLTKFRAGTSQTARNRGERPDP